MLLKDRLLQNELTIGSWLTIGHPSIVEIMASARFEWLVIDLEHSSIDLTMAQALITTIQAKNMKALVRVSKNEEVIIKRVLDMGADGIIVPMIKNASEAKQAVDFAYYPPFGKRGAGLYRAQNYGIGFEEYKEKNKNETVVIAQIEHIEAVQNIDEILSVDGIDGTIVGPYDLSGSMGKPGRYNDADIKEALEKVKEACFVHKKPLGFHVISSDPSKLKEKIDDGYTFLAYSLDFFFLGDSARYGASMIGNSQLIACDNWNKQKKDLISDKKTNPLFGTRDIWFVQMGENIGFEQNGKGERFLRPVLIIKKFSKNLFFAIPMTSTLREGSYFGTVELNSKKSGLLFLQARSFDAKRLRYKVGTIGSIQFKMITKSFAELFNPSLEGSD